MVGTTGYKTKKSRLDLLEIITKNLHNNFQTDEAKVNLIGREMQEEEETTSSVKHRGGYIMAWACMAASGYD